MVLKMLLWKHLSGRANVKGRIHGNKEEFRERQIFTVSNRWLQKWKLSYGVPERKANGEVREVPKYTASA